MSYDFYKSFEDQFRGTEELIRARLNFYTPILRALSQKRGSGKALDLGCGRGEWLELIKENGFDGVGIDLNNSMLNSARDKGLVVKVGDAIEALQQQDDDSIVVITAFHLVEHISFNLLQELIKEAFRALEPGGILILETPNVENLRVGTSSFYLDPTHQKPIPPQLLRFTVESSGYSRVQTFYLQHGNYTDPALYDVLVGASPDYAIVAQKGGASDREQELSSFFAMKHGLSMEDLALKYDFLLDERFSGLTSKISKIHAELNLKFEKNFLEVLKKMETLESKMLRELIANQKKINQYIKDDLEQEIQKLQRNTSILQHDVEILFKNQSVGEKLMSLIIKNGPRSLTEHLRLKVFRLNSAKRNFNLKSKNLLDRNLSVVRSYVNNRPRLKKIIILVLSKFPKIENRLKYINAKQNYDDSPKTFVELPVVKLFTLVSKDSLNNRSLVFISSREDRNND